MNIQANKILIIGPAWVGDMVMAQALFTLLKQRDPAVIIDVLAPTWSHALLTRMPEVNRALTLPLGHGQLQLAERWRLGQSLKNDGYQQAILLPNSWKSAIVPWAARIPQRTGWLGEYRYGLLNDVRHLDKQRLPLMVQRFLALGLPKGTDVPENYTRPALKVTAESVQTSLAKHNIVTPEQPILALCPGAEFGPAKRWPSESYAAIANEKLAEGWAVWLFGSAKDQPVAAEIQAITQHRCVDLTGRTALAEAIDLLSLARVVVTNDSGLMHVAAALNRPIVVVYGSSSPRFTPPLSDNVKILSLNLSCSPCFKRECPLEHLKCLRDLPPAMVSTALSELVYS